MIDAAELRRLLTEAKTGTLTLHRVAGGDEYYWSGDCFEVESEISGFLVTGTESLAELAVGAVNALPALLDLQDENAALLARAEAAEAKVARVLDELRPIIGCVAFEDRGKVFLEQPVYTREEYDRLRALAGKEGEE